MAEIQFEKKINLTEYEKNSSPRVVQKLMIGNETNNDIYQFFISNDTAHEKPSHIEYTPYDELEWKNPLTSMTSHKVRNIGMKTFPGIGAIGFFTPRVGTSKILIPIHVKNPTRFKAPTMLLTEIGDNFNIIIKPPAEVAYMCYRIVMENGVDTFEYISYSTVAVVPKPTVIGTYLIYCIGYVNEGQHISEESNHVEYIVNEGTATQVPNSVTIEELWEQVNQLRENAT